MIITTPDPSELALLQVATLEPEEKEPPSKKKKTKKKSEKTKKSVKKSKEEKTSKKKSSSKTSKTKKSTRRSNSSNGGVGSKKRPKKSNSEISDATQETVDTLLSELDADLDELSITSATTTDSTSNSSSSSSNKKRVTFDNDIQIREIEPIKRVTFGNVQIREYERIAGIHPDTRIGVSLSIGWKYYDGPSEQDEESEAENVEDSVAGIISIDEYESNLRKSGEVITKCPRFDSTRRRYILQNEFNISDSEIDTAMKVSRQVRKQRIQSNKQDEDTITVKFELALIKLARKVKYQAITTATTNANQRQHNKTLIQYNKELKHIKKQKLQSQ